jgi:glycosyltransferase involved in cell wall biosynthesis
MKILFLSKKIVGTGNFSTALRISSYFQSFGHEVVVSDGEDHQEADMDPTLYDIVIALHALHFADILKRCTNATKTIIILGGTDVNCSTPKHATDMQAILLGATKIVSFSSVLTAVLLSKIPSIPADLIATIPQASLDEQMPPTPMSSAAPTASWRQRLGYDQKDFVVLLPAGIRTVKAPHFVAEEMRRWHYEDSNANFLIIGPVLEGGYVERHTMFCPECVRDDDAEGSAASELDGSLSCSPDGAGAAHNTDTNMKISYVDDKQFFIHRHYGGCNKCDRISHSDTCSSSSSSSSSGVCYAAPLPRTHFLQLLGEADVMINSSESEGMSGAILEAMAMGIPVVARYARMLEFLILLMYAFLIFVL